MSFRSRILVVVLTVAVVPMALTGLWLTRSASRSGENLLRTRLDEALDRTIGRVGSNWLKQRSDLLFLGEAEGVQQALLGRAGQPSPNEPPADLEALFRDLHSSVIRASIRDTLDRVLWTLTRDSREATSALHVELPIHQRFPALRLGTLDVDLGLEGLLGPGDLPLSVAGMVLGVEDAVRDAPLVPLPFDPELMRQDRFDWGQDEWLTARRVMTEPPLRLVAAAPLSAFAGPFESAARRGTWLLAGVALAGLAAAWLLSRRLTASLERLVDAAEAVSRGHLGEQISSTGTDEVGRVAHAFNTMTSSLSRTLGELAAKERLAAVGEFAASLAHEVRNPLTAIRIDLQRVEERLPADSPLREPQARALREIARLDATVSETLDVARSGDWRAGGITLDVPINAAADAAAHAFDAHGSVLDRSGVVRPLTGVRGDASALEQLFLNLFLNAAAALDPGGRAWIGVEEEADHVTVSVHDDGPGMPPEILERVFQPLFTTRADGTGLGLTVARRIVEQHGGTIAIDSEVGEGTTVVVRLPVRPVIGHRPAPAM